MDYAIGEIVDSLKERGVYNDTIIVFQSDVRCLDNRSVEVLTLFLGL